jgi:hypothetical protein
MVVVAAWELKGEGARASDRCSRIEKKGLQGRGMHGWSG